MDLQGELIINEPVAEVPEKMFEEFINLVNPEQTLLFLKKIF